MESNHPLPVCQSTGWCTCGRDCWLFFSWKTSWITFILHLELISITSWLKSAATYFSTCRAGIDSQDIRGRKVDRVHKIWKICKTTSHSLETFYSLTLLNHCSSPEPCAPSCEWWALIIDTARWDWVLWSQDQLGRRTLQYSKFHLGHGGKTGRISLRLFHSSSA